MRKSTRRPVSRFGSVMVTTILFLPVLITFAIASIDVGYLNTEKSRMQTVADMAVVSALGNVLWQGPPAAEEETEITSNINAYLTVNGYDPTLFGEPTFVHDDDDLHVQTVTLEQSVPVKTFFWSFIQPGADRLNVYLKSTAEVIYGTGGREVAPDFGIYARNKATLQGASLGTGTYDSTEVTFTEYYNLPMAAGDEIEIGNTEYFGDLFSTRIIDAGNATIYGDVTMGDIDDPQNDLPLTSIFERYWEPGYTEQDVIDNSTTINPPIEAVVPEVFIEVPTEAEVQAMPDYAAWSTLADQGVFQYAGSTIKIKNNNTLYLEAGKSYLFPQDFDSSQGTIEIVNPLGLVDPITTIHTSNDFDASGQFNQNDVGLKLVGLGDDSSDIETFKFTGGSNVYMDVVAPFANVETFGGSTIKGRIYAYDVTIQGEFYYDLSLASHNFEQNGAPAVTIKAHLTE